MTISTPPQKPRTYSESQTAAVLGMSRVTLSKHRKAHLLNPELRIGEPMPTPLSGWRYDADQVDQIAAGIMPLYAPKAD